MTRAEQQALLQLARERGIAIISDEVYGTLIYDGATHAPSFLEIAEPDDSVFVVNSFSKPWAMTGWRIGWLVHPALAWPPDAGHGGSPTIPARPCSPNMARWRRLSPQGDAFRANHAGALPQGPRGGARISSPMAATTGCAG